MKARLPKGVGGGPGNQQSMVKQAQQMQEEMGKLQEELDVREYTVTAGGGAVTAVVDGKHIVKKLEIKPEVVDPEDVDMLADLVMAAVNEAIPPGGGYLRGGNVENHRRYQHAGIVLNRAARRKGGADVLQRGAAGAADRTA